MQQKSNRNADKHENGIYKRPTKRIGKPDLNKLKRKHGKVDQKQQHRDLIDRLPLEHIVAKDTHNRHDQAVIHQIFASRPRKTKKNKEITLDTRELRNVLEDVPLDSYEILKWIEEYLNEQYIA